MIQVKNVCDFLESTMPSLSFPRVVFSSVIKMYFQVSNKSGYNKDRGPTCSGPCSKLSQMIENTESLLRTTCVPNLRFTQVGRGVLWVCVCASSKRELLPWKT